MNYDSLTSAELVTKYNEAAQVRGLVAVKRFSDRRSAIRRTRSLLESPVKKAKPAAKAKKAKPAAERKKSGMRFVFPYRGDENFGKIQSENSLRGRAVTLLKAGAYFTDVVALVKQFDKDRGHGPGHQERRAYEVVRLLHYYVGYGLKQDADGKIYIHRKG